MNKIKRCIEIITSVYASRGGLTERCWENGKVGSTLMTLGNVACCSTDTYCKQDLAW